MLDRVSPADEGSRSGEICPKPFGVMSNALGHDHTGAPRNTDIIEKEG
jgi:hypothetical protein